MTRRTAARQPAGNPPATPAPSSPPEAPAGRSGETTATEREALCLAQLRLGEPPFGWLAARAVEWGVAPQQASKDLAEARRIFEASRTPEAAQRLAHELTQQAHELLPEIERIAREPIVTEDPRLLVARLREREARAKGLRELAALKLKTAASYVAIYRKPPEGPPGGGAPPPPLTDGALK